MTNPVIDKFGNKCWYNEQRELHREDGGPAVEYSDGTKCWYLHGRLHRIGSPAVLHKNGDGEWYKNGLKHRVGGPAYSSKGGSQEWRNGKLHRLDGPAMIYPSGRESWYVNGKKIDIQPILERLDISSDWRNWTDEEKFLVRLALP